MPAASDAVVFYSDGVIEAHRGREEYGAERLCRGLEENASRSAAEIGERLVADLESFIGDETPHDDVTLIVVKNSRQTRYENSSGRDGDHTAP